MSYLYLVLKIWVGPSSQEKLNHLLMAIEASSFKCCPTILYGRMGESNHMRWLHNNCLMEVHKKCLMEVHKKCLMEVYKNCLMEVPF